ncbi:hypothetical protein, conserved [Leishmania lindenbergi]|uniref:Uncharacterized protein n=1 Tax=Leishmania lindenbergi TaxID=651832 RepID=A0AAW3ARG8_9TRYP
MSHHCHTNMNALSLDCLSCYEEQRARMKSIDLNYLQQKSNECIQNRCAPSHLHMNYTCHQAAEAVAQGSTFPRFVRNGSLPARQSELTTRVAAQRNYLAYCRKPLECAGHISAQHHSKPPSAVPLQQRSMDSVLFDEERFHEDTVFVNGEPVRVSKGYQSEHAFYGLDSPTAAILDAVSAANADHVGKSNAVFSLGAVRKGTPESRQQSITASRAAEHRRQISGLSGTSKEQHTIGSASSERYCDYLSSSGRHYRVFRLHKRQLPPIEERKKAEGLSLYAKGAKEVTGTEKARNRESVEGDSEIKGLCEQSKDQVAARCYNSGRKSAENDKSLLPVRRGRIAKPYKLHEALEDARSKHTTPRRPGAASHQNKSATKSTYRSCGRSLIPMSPVNYVPCESSAPLLLFPSRKPLEDIVDTCAGCRDCGGALAGIKRRLRSHGYRDAAHGDRAERRLPPIGGGQGSHPAPPPAPHCQGRARDEHRHRYQSHEGGRRATKGRKRRSNVLSDFNEHCPSLFDSALCVCVSISSSIDRASDTSDCVVVDKQQRRGAAQHGRARSASPLILADGDEGHDSFDSTYSCSSDRDTDWEDADSTSSLSSSASLSSPELSSTSTRRVEMRRPRICVCRRSRRHSTHSPPSVSLKGRRSGSRGSESNRRERHSEGNRQNTRRPVSSSYLPSSSSADCGLDGGPGNSLALPRVDHTKKRRCDSPIRPPSVRAVLPAHPPGILPPLMEEVLPSTRYATSSATPLAQTTGATPSCASPVAPPQRTEQGTTGKREQSHGAVDPTRRAYQEMPMSPLQVTHFRDLTTPSVASSGPVCASLQVSGINTGSAPPEQQSGRAGRSRPSPATEPLDLDYITEHVLQVVQSRLAGTGRARDTERVGSQRARGRKDDAGEALRKRECARQMDVEVAAKRTAEQSKLRDLLQEAQQEALYVRAEQLSLSGLTASLQVALVYVTRLIGRDDGPDGNTSPLGRMYTAAERDGSSSMVIGTPNSSTLVYGAAEHNAVMQARGGTGASSENNVGDMTAAVYGSHAAFLPDSTIDAVTLQRLIAELRQRRQRHEVGQRLQQQRAEEVEANALEAARQQQCKREVDELVASERQARASLHEAEESALDGVLVIAASSLGEAVERMVAVQHRALLSFCEEELNKRTSIIASEEAEAADFWEVATDLWQAAAEDEKALEEEERQRLVEEAMAAAAWREEKNAEAERLQAEVRRMEADAVAAQIRKMGGEGNLYTTGSADQLTVATKKVVLSNLIPGQLLSIQGGKSIESGGKIRLVGDPHVAAVEARARERRRMDRLRQHRLLSALPLHPEANKVNDSVGSRLSSRQPSTVRMGINGSAVSAPKPLSRASSRGLRVSSSYQLSLDESGRVGVQSPSQGRLQSQSNFVFDGDIDLHVYGRKVGTPFERHSRASTPASARGALLHGGGFSAATPYKRRAGEGGARDVQHAHLAV